MIQSFHGRIPRETLLEWLDSSSAAPLQISSGKSQDNFTTVISLPKAKDIDYLFCETSYRIPSIHQNDQFTFCGLYLRQDHSLRLADLRLMCAVSGLMETECVDRDELRRQFCKQVNCRVEALIADGRNNLAITELSSEATKRHLDYYLEHGARDEAIQAYFSGVEPNVRFYADFRLNDWDEDTVLAYLQTPDTLIEREAGQYIKDHQEQSLLTFLENDALQHEYTSLLQDDGSPIHRMKDIPAQDRREFERMFGKYADYHAEDIPRITYGRDTIYEATPAPVEDLEQDEEPSMTMGGM